MRLLFVVPPLTGHITPLRAVAAELERRGHVVAWCGPEPETSRLAGTGPVLPAGASAPFAVELRPAALRGFAALKYLWEQYLTPLADAMLPGVRAAIERFAPDLLVVDQQALAGALAASAARIAWVTSASTPAGLADPAVGMPKITAWVRGLQDELCARHGAAPQDLRFSPDLVIAFAIPQLAAAPAASCRARVRYVGATRPQPSSVAFPWAVLDGRPLVVVTLGTSNAAAGRRFLAHAVSALSALPHVQGVVIDPSGELESRDVVLRPAAPLPDLLERAALTVCHGGHNTVCESLWAGVPLVVAPIRDDQAVLGARIVEHRAGLRLRFDRATADDLRPAITSILTNPGYRAQAARLRRSLESTDAACSAAQLLESTMARRTEGSTCSRI